MFPEVLSIFTQTNYKTNICQSVTNRSTRGLMLKTHSVPLIILSSVYSLHPNPLTPATEDSLKLVEFELM